MAVRVVEKDSGKSVSGKFARIQGGEVALFSGCMSDKKGGLRGCGRKTTFPEDRVTVTADDPEREIKRQ